MGCVFAVSVSCLSITCLFFLSLAKLPEIIDACAGVGWQCAGPMQLLSCGEDY